MCATHIQRESPFSGLLCASFLGLCHVRTHLKSSHCCLSAQRIPRIQRHYSTFLLSKWNQWSKVEWPHHDFKFNICQLLYKLSWQFSVCRAVTGQQKGEERIKNKLNFMGCTQYGGCLCQWGWHPFYRLSDSPAFSFLFPPLWSHVDFASHLPNSTPPWSHHADSGLLWVPRHLHVHLISWIMNRPLIH